MDLLDTSALLAYIKKEEGSEKVSELFKQATRESFTVFMHEINYIELIYKCFQFYGKTPTQKIIASLQSPFFAVVNWKEKQNEYYCAHLKYTYKNLSLADAIGLAFTKFTRGKFWASDQELEPIAKAEKIQIIMLR